MANNKISQVALLSSGFDPYYPKPRNRHTKPHRLVDQSAHSVCRDGHYDNLEMKKAGQYAQPKYADIINIYLLIIFSLNLLLIHLNLKTF